MNLAEIYAQQQRDIETFKAVRDKTWTDMKKDHEAFTEAHGGKENLPPEYRKRMDDQIDNYNKQWSMEGGTHHKAMLEQHAKQRESITGKPSKDMPQAKRQQQDMLDEKQKQLNKIIAQQKAIRAKAEEAKQKKGRSR